jgi:hypothetical protein
MRRSATDVVSFVTADQQEAGAGALRGRGRRPQKPRTAGASGGDFQPAMELVDGARKAVVVY